MSRGNALYKSYRIAPSKSRSAKTAATNVVTVSKATIDIRFENGNFHPLIYILNLLARCFIGNLHFINPASKVE